MTKYIALLRGINIWGHKKVEMLRLREMFELLEFFDVSTYLNSGNVIFSSDHEDIENMTQRIEDDILKIFWFEVKVLVINHETLNNIYEAIPTTWICDIGMLPHIAFLWQEIDSPDIIRWIKINPEKDTVRYVSGAILWNVELKNWNKDTVYRFATGKISQHVTIRSMNTVRKLAEMMK